MYFVILCELFSVLCVIDFTQNTEKIHKGSQNLELYTIIYHKI